MAEVETFLAHFLGANVSLGGKRSRLKLAREFAEGIAGVLGPRSETPFAIVRVGRSPEVSLLAPGATNMFDRTTDSGAYAITREISVHRSILSKNPLPRAAALLVSIALTGRRPPSPRWIGAHEAMHAFETVMPHPEWRKAAVVPGYPRSLMDDVIGMIARRAKIPPGRVTAGYFQDHLSANSSRGLQELVADAAAAVDDKGPDADPIFSYVMTRFYSSVPPFTPGPGATLKTWNGRFATRDLTAFDTLKTEEYYPVRRRGFVERLKSRRTGRKAANHDHGAPRVTRRSVQASPARLHVNESPLPPPQRDPPTAHGQSHPATAPLVGMAHLNATVGLEQTAGPPVSRSAPVSGMRRRSELRRTKDRRAERGTGQ